MIMEYFVEVLQEFVRVTMGWTALISAFLIMASICLKDFISVKYRKKWVNGITVTKHLSKEDIYNILNRIQYSWKKAIHYDANANIVIETKKLKYMVKITENEDDSVSIIFDSGAGGKYEYEMDKNNLYQFFLKEIDNQMPIDAYAICQRNMKIKKAPTIATIILFASLLIAFIFDSLPNSQTYINSVKKATPKDYPNITYGDAIESIFSEKAEWEYFSTEDGDKVVQFTGFMPGITKSYEICMQFVIYDDIFQLEYMEFDGEPQGLLNQGLIMTAIFAGANINDAISKESDIYTKDEPPLDEVNQPDDITPSVEETQQFEDEVDADEVDVDEVYFWNYEDIISATKIDYGSVDYANYDIDKDGVEDLIVGYGFSNSDYKYDVYTMSNGHCEFVGEFYGVSNLYESEDGNGILAVYGHMGYQVVSLITKERNSLQVETLIEENLPLEDDTDYYENDYPIPVMTEYME